MRLAPLCSPLIRSLFSCTTTKYRRRSFPFTTEPPGSPFRNAVVLPDHLVHLVHYSVLILWSSHRIPFHTATQCLRLLIHGTDFNLLSDTYHRPEQNRGS